MAFSRKDDDQLEVAHRRHAILQKVRKLGLNIDARAIGRSVAGYGSRFLSLALAFVVQAALYRSNPDAFLDFNLAYGAQNLLAQVGFLGLSYRSYRAGGGFDAARFEILATSLFIGWITIGGTFALASSTSAATLAIGVALAGISNIASENERAKVHQFRATLISQTVPWLVAGLTLALVDDPPYRQLPAIMYVLSGTYSVAATGATILRNPPQNWRLRPPQPAYFWRQADGLPYVVLVAAQSNFANIMAGTLRSSEGAAVLMATKVAVSLQSILNYGLSGPIRDLSHRLISSSSKALDVLRDAERSSRRVAATVGIGATIASVGVSALGLPAAEDLIWPTVLAVLLVSTPPGGLLLPQIGINALPIRRVLRGLLASVVTLLVVFVACQLMTGSLYSILVALMCARVAQRYLLRRDLSRV